MGSQKAWYWLASGVLALGINSEYQSGNLQWAHLYVDHFIAVANDYGHCARNYLAQFEMLLAQHPRAITAAQNRVEDADLRSQDTSDLVREQVEYAVSQAEMVRREVERHRPEIVNALKEMASHEAEMEIAREATLETSGDAVMICPRAQRIRVNIPQVRIPEVRVEVPQVRVEVPRVRVYVPQVHVAPM